jgi:hypothetical protein
MKFSSVLALALSSGILAFTVSVPAASAAFIGSYDVSNWTFTNTVANGSVNITTAPGAITLIGGDNNSGFFGTTDFSIPVTSDGSISFSWGYSTADEVSINDPAYYLLNGIPFQLSDNNSSLQSGQVFSIPVRANDLFAFRVETVDNTGGSAALSISNFEATAIPTPALLPGMIIFGIASARTALKGRSQRF